MTTMVKVSTNGNYVSEGNFVVTNKQSEPFKVGPGSNVEKTFYVPHGSQASLHLTERDATAEEIEAATPKTDAA